MSDSERNTSAETISESSNSIDRIADAQGASTAGEPPAAPACTDVQVLEGQTVVLPRRRPLGGRHAGYVQPDRLRGQIQTTALLKRLLKISRGRVTGSPAHLAVQVQAAKVLLAKSLPDIQSVMISGDGDAPLVILTRME
jgi:hypothetical protein